jgi:hypothetical protein
MRSIGFLTTSSTESATLVFKIDNRRPVELLDLTASLMAVGEQFKKFVRQHRADEKPSLSAHCSVENHNVGIEKSFLGENGCHRE